MMKLNKDQIKQICQEYQEGKSIRKVGKNFGVSSSTILHWLKEKKIKRRPRLQYCRKLTLIEKKKLCEKYKQGKTVSYLVKKYKNPQYTIRNILVAENIKIQIGRHCYAFNENYFSQPLDEHRSYWIGFIMADGCIYKNILQFNLHWKDRLHLEKFKEDIQANYPIYHIRNACRLMISSKKLCDSLAKFNIVPRKSLIAKTPTNIPDNLMRHFWRGVFDGDGCITLNRKITLVILLDGSKNIIKNFIKFIGENLKIKGRGNFFRCEISSYKALHILNLLYKNTNIDIKIIYKT